jgi:hypothetical protein
MNQVVSVALVAQQEVEDDAATTIALPGEETENVVARKKVVQRPVYFVSSLLQGA